MNSNKTETYWFLPFQVLCFEDDLVASYLKRCGTSSGVDWTSCQPK